MSAHENVLPIHRPADPVANQDNRLGSMLVEAGKLERPDVDRITALQRAEGIRFGEAAVRLSLISIEELHHAVAKQFSFSYLLPGDGVSSELVAAYEPEHVRTEELRTLRTQLLVRWYNAGIRQRMLA